MLPYCPGLRFKKGEYSAVANLMPDIQKFVEPRFVIPPPKEYDHELERVPTIDEIAYMTGERIGKNWPVRRAFLDANFIANQLDDDGLRKIFRIAQGRNPQIVPVARLADLRSPLYKEFMCRSALKIAVLVTYEEVDVDAIREALAMARVAAEECVLFIDFSGAPLDPEIAAGSIAGIFDLADQVGRWQKIIFQASNFPSKNPAVHGGDELISRDEWSVFHAALDECDVSPDRIGYGDFGADCSGMVFPKGKGGGRAIRHIRYTTPTHTLVVRADSEGKDDVLMQDVCQRIIDSGQFAGQAFSRADHQIYRVAQRLDGPGNATMWREWNMIHHMTRVVRDLGVMAGVSFSDGPTTVAAEQFALFEEDQDA
ncbi:beta family protein [Bosea lathyri]|uniref:Beta protein n=1 Tax=Bosea lathyri TaxID=1036778 RepID=A0A1H6D3I0_9HYPH|nr:beta family protein [Bosea lathyri]SEG79860.1 Beta protein [Bosea lathyri]